MKTLSTIYTFIRDNLWLVLAALFLGYVFFHIGHFTEFVYAAIRLIAAIVMAALILHWKFPGTLHKYVNEDRLIADFNAADPTHRLYIAFGTLAVLFIVSVLCFINP